MKTHNIYYLQQSLGKRDWDLSIIRITSAKNHVILPSLTLRDFRGEKSRYEKSC